MALHQNRSKHHGRKKSYSKKIIKLPDANWGIYDLHLRWAAYESSL